MTTDQAFEIRRIQQQVARKKADKKKRDKQIQTDVSRIMAEVKRKQADKARQDRIRASRGRAKPATAKPEKLNVVDWTPNPVELMKELAWTIIPAGRGRVVLKPLLKRIPKPIPKFKPAPKPAPSTGARKAGTQKKPSGLSVEAAERLKQGLSGPKKTINQEIFELERLRSLARPAKTFSGNPIPGNILRAAAVEQRAAKLALEKEARRFATKAQQAAIREAELAKPIKPHTEIDPSIAIKSLKFKALVGKETLGQQAKRILEGQKRKAITELNKERAKLKKIEQQLRKELAAKRASATAAVGAGLSVELFPDLSPAPSPKTAPAPKAAPKSARAEVADPA